MCDKVVEKIVNAKAKASLQLPSRIREINFRYPKRYKPLVKKDKDNAYWKQRDKTSNKDKKKAQSHNPSSFANQP